MKTLPVLLECLLTEDFLDDLFTSWEWSELEPAFLPVLEKGAAQTLVEVLSAYADYECPLVLPQSLTLVVGLLDHPDSYVAVSAFEVLLHCCVQQSVVSHIEYALNNTPHARLMAACHARYTEVERC